MGAAGDEAANRGTSSGSRMSSLALRLRSLSPLAVNANGTAQGTGEADEAVVKVGPAEAGCGDGEIGEIGQELELAGSTLTTTNKSG